METIPLEVLSKWQDFYLMTETKQFELILPSFSLKIIICSHLKIFLFPMPALVESVCIFHLKKLIVHPSVH